MKPVSTSGRSRQALTLARRSRAASASTTPLLRDGRLHRQGAECLLRSFSWGHVRQLDRLSRKLLARGWAAGAGPGAAPFRSVRGYHPLLVAAGTGLMARLREGREHTLPADGGPGPRCRSVRRQGAPYSMLLSPFASRILAQEDDLPGGADVAETTYTPPTTTAWWPMRGCSSRPRSPTHLGLQELADSSPRPR